MQQITHALAALPGAQVHVSSGVVSTALVYQHHEADDPLTEDIDDDADSSRVH
ncbi:hypothetical protein [Caballeronia temeraria]|uniref:hypothetical protein n=1 Tax=Caballeronia temeraria TaxID=1777137 RepID=UPI000AFF9B19|nr:hypothetical protein [Caballeronia temeraria]